MNRNKQYLIKVLPNGFDADSRVLGFGPPLSKVKLTEIKQYHMVVLTALCGVIVSKSWYGQRKMSFTLILFVLTVSRAATLQCLLVQAADPYRYPGVEAPYQPQAEAP